FSTARCDAVYTGAVPLRQATAGRAAENVDPNQPEFRSALMPFRSDRACVTRALEKDRHGLERRFDPAPFVSPHKSHACHRSRADSGQIYFLIKLMSPLRSTRATRMLERSSVCVLRRMSSSKSCVEMWLHHIMATSHSPLRTITSGLPLTRIPNPWE